MLIFFKKKSAQQRIRAADRSNQRLRKRRSNIDSSDRKTLMKLNTRIHRNNVEIDIAKRELSQPKIVINNTTKSINFSKNSNSKELHLHGHYHDGKTK